MISGDNGMFIQCSLLEARIAMCATSRDGRTLAAKPLESVSGPYLEQAGNRLAVSNNEIYKTVRCHLKI